SYVHDINCGSSKVVILDAQNIEGEPQAVIELPVRVPLGFHGNWIATAR
ncbi:MAG: carotenoid oxygenase family protein, partial [Moraxellaceae bacterium]